MTNFPEYKKAHGIIKGIFYDFDGTLVDSREKNFNVTKMIVKRVTGNPPDTFSILRTQADYEKALGKTINWRDFYSQFFQLDEAATDYAGGFWTEYQLRDRTPAPVFEGIDQILEEFKMIDHAIISQNSHHLIKSILKENNIEHYFDFIIGYGEVGIRNQKPDPEGLITSIQKIDPSSSGKYIYIGDHESDVKFVSSANHFFYTHTLNAEVISIGAHYQDQVDLDLQPWKQQPDYHVHTVSELREVLRGLVMI